MEISERIWALAKDAEKALAERFSRIDEIAFENTKKVMDAFREHRVSEAMFAPTSGYGYDDRGRDTLDAIWADVMGAEAAFVRHSIANGTHALTIGLFGLLRPNDILWLYCPRRRNNANMFHVAKIVLFSHICKNYS